MPSADLAPSCVLDRYRLVRRLGSGGFGTVWLADDLRLGRQVAVKRIPVDDPDHAERARREAVAAARLGHPGIVALYEAGTDDDACYLVSELVRGRTLAALEAEGALSDRDVVEIGVALCDALAHAHARGVVHRDVKPANVIVPEAIERGGGPAKLTDFGIARVVGDDALTRTGDVLGTLAYMAPEQAEGRRITPAVDLYALALVLYEALSGHHPFRGATPAETARRLGVRAPPLARLRRDLPRRLCAVIDGALAPDPGARGTLAGLREALLVAADEVGDEPGLVAEPGLAARTRTWWGERCDTDLPEPDDDEDDELGERRAPAPRPVRLAGAAGAGVLAGAVAALLPGLPAGAAPPLVAGIVAGAALIVPRLAWLGAALAALAALAAVGEPGLALVALPAVVAVPLLLFMAPRAWSLPALAPALGLAGLALAFPALAGQAATVPRRAALGALGALWLVLGQALSARALLAPPVPSAPPTDAATGSSALTGVLDVHLLALAGAFAVAAVVLPWLVRGRRLAPDAAAAALWAAGLALAVRAALAPAAPRDLVAGAAVAAGLAVLARAARPSREPARRPALA